MQLIEIPPVWRDVIGWATVVFGFLAAGFWFWASVVEVPDNIDTFIGALQKIGRLNAYGAGSAGFAAICALLTFVSQPR